MKNLNELYIWENIKAIQYLDEYINNINKYLKEKQNKNEKECIKTRMELLHRSELYEKIFIRANITPYLVSGSRAIGFIRHSFTTEFPELIDETPTSVANIFDLYNRAKGIYVRNSKKAILNTINPLSYLNIIIKALLKNLFGIIFSKKTIEGNLIINKFISFVTLLANLIAIWYFLDKIGIVNKIRNLF